MSADHFLKRLDRVGEALGNRPVAYRRGLDDFRLIQCLAFIISRGQQPDATPEHKAEARYHITQLGLQDDYGSPSFRKTQAQTA